MGVRCREGEGAEARQRVQRADCFPGFGKGAGGDQEERHGACEGEVELERTSRVAACQLGVVLDVLDREAGTVADGKFRVAESVLGIAEIGEKIALRRPRRFRAPPPPTSPLFLTLPPRTLT